MADNHNNRGVDGRLAKRKIGSNVHVAGAQVGTGNGTTDPKRRDFVAFKAFLNICDHWQLKTAQCRTLLGEMPPATFNRMKADVTKNRDHLSGSLSRDTIERISYILGIYKALHILLPSENADQWVVKPNSAPQFNGRSALDRMLQGNITDLAVVRQYLDAERGSF